MDLFDPHPHAAPSATPRASALDAWTRNESKSATTEADLRRRYTPDTTHAPAAIAPTLLTQGFFYAGRLLQSE